MPQSLSNVFVHIVYSTKKRQRWLTDEICFELYPYISTILKNSNCHPYEVGGMADHVHILCTLPKTTTISDLIKEIKISTSKLIKSKNDKYNDFFWQHGYGVFSISPSHLNIVRSYIIHQSDHHKKITFEDELRKLLNKYFIKYDEKYLWD